MKGDLYFGPLLTDEDILAAVAAGMSQRTAAARTGRSKDSIRRLVNRAEREATAAAQTARDEKLRRKAEAERERRARIKRHEHAKALGRAPAVVVKMSPEEFERSVAELEAAKVPPDMQALIDAGRVIRCIRGCPHTPEMRAAGTCTCKTFIATYWTRYPDPESDYLIRTGDGGEDYAGWLDRKDAERAAEVERRIREHARQRARLAEHPDVPTHDPRLTGIVSEAREQ